MNKSSRKPRISRLLLTAIAIVTLLVGGCYVYPAMGNYRAARRINSEYSQIVIPSALSLQEKHYHGPEAIWSGFIQGQGYVYGYRTTGHQTVRQVHAMLAAAFQQAGYTVSKDANPDPNANLILLDAANSRLNLQVIINAVADSNDPDAQAGVIGVLAYE